MRCDIYPNWSTDKKGKCGRLLCTSRGNTGCAIFKRGKGLLGRLKSVRAKRLEIEKELVV